MIFAVDLPVSGEYSEPRRLMQLAREAEEAGLGRLLSMGSSPSRRVSSYGRSLDCAGRNRRRDLPYTSAYSSRPSSGVTPGNSPERR